MLRAGTPNSGVEDAVKKVIDSTAKKAEAQRHISKAVALTSKAVGYAVSFLFFTIEVLIIEWAIRTTFTGSTPRFPQWAAMWLFMRLLFRQQKAFKQSTAVTK